MRDFCHEYAALLYRHTGYNCAVTDTDIFVTSATEKEFFHGRTLSRKLENFLSGRRSGYFRLPEAESLLPEYGIKELIVTPILLRGDVIGSVMLVSKTAMTMPDTLIRHLEIAADFLARQAE